MGDPIFFQEGKALNQRVEIDNSALDFAEGKNLAT